MKGCVASMFCSGRMFFPLVASLSCTRWLCQVLISKKSTISSSSLQSFLVTISKFLLAYTETSHIPWESLSIMYDQVVFKVKTTGLLNIISICQFVEYSAKPISFSFVWRGEEWGEGDVVRCQGPLSLDWTSSWFIWEGSGFKRRQNAQIE